MKRNTLYLTLSFTLAACGSQEMGPTETSGWESSEEAANESSEDEGFDPICLPGDMMCAEEGGIDVCAPTGLEWVNEPCPKYAECKTCIGDDDPLCQGVSARCAGPCDPDMKPASSEGCSFVATRLLFVRPGHAMPHSLFVGNNDTEGRDATVDFIGIEEGTRDEVILETEVLAPGEVHEFILEHPPIMTGSSLLRTGGIYRIKSDLPVSAVQMSPHPPANRLPDSSLLLPEEAERTQFVVPGAPGKGLEGAPDPWSGYATIIALHDETVVSWTSPHVATFGNGAPMPPAAAGETVSVTLNRYDNMRISATQDDGMPNWHTWDISGLVVESTKPISVFSGNSCGSYPETGKTCDNMQEQVFPLTYWGDEYVGPASPDRMNYEYPLAMPPVAAEQRTYWRIFAGADDTNVTVTPPVPELPLSMDGLSSEIHLESRGDFVLFSSGLDEHLLMTGDRPFLPVQYHQSYTGGGATYNATQTYQMALGGDPSMCQMVPTAQWLDNYTFLLTGRFDREYLQIIRRIGDATITLTGPDGVPTDIPDADFTPIGEFEVVTHYIDTEEEADYRISSEDTFGILQGGDNLTDIPNSTVGHAESSYCHPGGIRIVDIFAP